MTGLQTLCLGLVLVACQQERVRPAPAPVYDGDVAALLREHCLPCHSGEDAKGGVLLETYSHTIGCSSSRPETSLVAPGDAGTPIVDVLRRSDHAGLLDAPQEARLRTWVELGAPLRQHGVHQPTILNPHASGWHGGLAAQNRFGPITRASDPNVCGRCHEGAPVTPKGITLPAPGATACTHCHREPEGVLACGTCHGDGAARSYPPRPACFFAAARQDAHRAHVESTRLLLEPLRCTSCHPFEPAALGGGTHGNGSVDVLLDPAQAGTDAGYDAVSGQCNVRCHQRGGMRATPSFGEQGPLGCGDCHAAPPEKHYAGACNGCHAEVDAEGTALRDNRLHMNGTVDLGDGSGGCGACHGQGDDPWPATPSHRLHRDTTLTAAIACNECHRVPQNVNTSGHLDVGQITPAEISLGARAHARGQAANYENGTCRQVACHGAGLPEGIERALRWDAPLTHSCSGCHGLPPTRAHPADDGCATLICHGAEVSVGNGRPAISETGRNLHVNGAIDIAQH